VEESEKKHVTILLGEGIRQGGVFKVVGEASSMAEARKFTRSREFVSHHLLGNNNGAYVLLVPGTGHQVFIPISSLVSQIKKGGGG